MKIKDRIRGFCRLAPERILPNPRNWRTHPEGQRAALQGVLADVGIADAVLVVPCSPGGLSSLAAAGPDGFGPWLMGYRGEFMLVDGHLRAETITGQPVPALVLDLDEREQAEVLATFDPVGDLAGMDRERFIALAGEFNSTNAAVQGLVADLAAMEERMRGAADEAFPADDVEDATNGDDVDQGAADRAAAKAALADALGAAEDGPNVNPTDELRKKWGTARGQLWIIPSATADGMEHRLLCGDSTSADDVGRLMDGATAVIMQTDPPYGVDYSKTKDGIPRSGYADHQERWGDIENDALTEDALAPFLRAVLSTAPLDDAAPVYLWHPAGATSRVFFTSMIEEGYLIHRVICWKKPGFSLTRSGMYHWAHEPCLYGWRKGHPPPWYGDKSQTSVWECGRDGDSGMHPTQKPIELFIRPLTNHTKPGEIAYEPFSGSGSQLLACEQLGRLCYAMELEPKYVAVALERASLRGMIPRLSI